MAAFNLIAFLYGYRYLTILHALRYTAFLDLQASLDKIVKGYSVSEVKNERFTLPVGVVAILMCFTHPTTGVSPASAGWRVALAEMAADAKNAGQV